MKILITIIFSIFFSSSFSQSLFIKRANVDGNDIVLLSDGTWQYFKNIDARKILDSSFYIYGKFNKSNCTEIICPIDSINRDLVWVPAFNTSLIYQDSTVLKYNLEFYKEVSSDDFLQTRMKYSNNEVRIIISGEKIEFIPLDTLINFYLVKIFHSNGFESWYYPITNVNRDANVFNPGEIIGSVQKQFYWQVRFYNHSISVKSIIDNKINSIQPGILFEKKNLLDNNFASRSNGFLTAIQKEMIQIEKTDDFNKLYEQEIINNKNKKK